MTESEPRGAVANPMLRWRAGPRGEAEARQAADCAASPIAWWRLGADQQFGRDPMRVSASKLPHPSMTRGSSPSPATVGTPTRPSKNLSSLCSRKTDHSSGARLMSVSAMQRAVARREMMRSIRSHNGPSGRENDSRRSEARLEILQDVEQRRSHLAKSR